MDGKAVSRGVSVGENSQGARPQGAKLARPKARLSWRGKQKLKIFSQRVILASPGKSGPGGGGGRARPKAARLKALGEPLALARAAGATCQQWHNFRKEKTRTAEKTKGLQSRSEPAPSPRRPDQKMAGKENHAERRGGQSLKSLESADVKQC
jgi:hypothetical protein